ncbi:MAG: hypothetical protein JST00_07790 [Deltaproteobacteria bacterium]|nr:hypothetical protein [Deltaproteobacteria bacterium]
MVRQVVTLFAFAVALVVGKAASANSGGLAGYTGKPNPAAPGGQSCNQCHNGGAAPTVSITGPATLSPGQAAEYSMVVQTNQGRASGGVAASDGTTLAPISGLRDSFGEMVQSAPATVSGGQATFRFRVTAPASGTIKLYAVGLASDGAGTGGDRAAQTTKDVVVSSTPGGAADAGGGNANGSTPSGSPQGGGASGSSTNGTTDKGSGAGAKTGTGASDGEEDDEDDGPDQSARWSRISKQNASCSAAPAGRRVEGASTYGALAAILAVAFLARGNRRSLRGKTAASVVALGALVIGCAAETDPAADGASNGSGSPQGSVDPTGGRDKTMASCFAACQNSNFSCRSKELPRSILTIELAPTDTGCAGSVKEGSAERKMAIDCGNGRACTNGSCVDATFSAFSFGYEIGGATTVCTRN